MKQNTEQPKKVIFQRFFFFITMILFIYLAPMSASAGISAGYSSQESVYTATSEIARMLTGGTSISRIAMNAANVQNANPQFSGAMAYVSISYDIEVVHQPNANASGVIPPPVTVTTLAFEGATVANEPDKRSLLETSWVNAILNQSMREISEYSGSYQGQPMSPSSLCFWVTVTIETEYKQEVYIKAGSNPSYTDTLHLQAVEQVKMGVVQSQGSAKILTMMLGSLEIMGPNSNKVDLNYSNKTNSGANKIEYLAAVCNSHQDSLNPFGVDKNSRLRLDATLNNKLLRIKNSDFGFGSEYLTRGDDKDLDTAIIRMIHALNGEPIGEPIPEEESSIEESSEQSSSGNEDSSTTGKGESSRPNEEKSKEEEKSNVSSSSQYESASSESSTEKSGELRGGSSSSSSKAEESSKATKDNIATEKSTLQSLSGKINKDEGNLLGGSLTGDIKNLTTEADVYSTLIDIEKMKGETEVQMRDDAFGIDASIKYVFLFGTVLLMIGSVPLAWKFISKNQDDQYVG